MADGLSSRKAKGKYPCSWSTNHKTDKNVLLPKWLVASLVSAVLPMLNRQGQLNHSSPGVRLQVWPSSRTVKRSQKKTVPRRVFMAVIEPVNLSHWPHDPTTTTEWKTSSRFLFGKALHKETPQKKVSLPYAFAHYLHSLETRCLSHCSMAVKRHQDYRHS